jgi:hypothetical protein
MFTLNTWQGHRQTEPEIEHVLIIVGRWSKLKFNTLRLGRGKWGRKVLGRRKPLEVHFSGPVMDKR